MFLAKHVRGLDLDGMDSDFKIDRDAGSPQVVRTCGIGRPSSVKECFGGVPFKDFE